jgi:hypothetical protein
MMRKMIRGKYDSQFKHNGKTLERGVFNTAMNYAQMHKGGVKLIQHIRSQPWETWRTL